MKRLETLSHLMAASVSKGLTLKEQVKVLSSAGLAPKEIAEILGVSGNNVRVTLSLMRKAKRKS